MPQNTTAGKLLELLHEQSAAVRDAVVVAAGLTTERADAAMIGALRLTLAEQLRLAEAALETAPQFRRQAFRLRGQALAARSFEANELVECHLEPPSQRWETSAAMRR
jgi:hypothetical protein